ncbi:MAG: S41 family peptidase [Bacteroidales bacterium]|nr:S41 family peptidase [Bacteroidales bacterium]
MINLLKTNITRIVILLFLFNSVLVLGQNSNNFEISKNLDIYTTLYRELNTNYVDEISPGDLMKTGIDAMLESLDPYTVYIPESEVEDYKFITTGQYGGVGALIQKQGDFIIVAEPYEGKPAHLAGIKAGDKILEVDGKSVEGKSTGDVSTILKGQPGTNVKVLIERLGIDSPIEIELERENVKIENIPYYGMLEDGVGYIKLTGFTQHAGKEVKEAFLELKDNNDLNGIILDLRGNGGGLLQEAVNITNIFVDKGQVVVSTKGKLPSKNHTYRTTNVAVDKEISLVILVDNLSASASEIVAGAIQDLDRGVVLGQRTFGKGLVQNMIPLSYNSQAKITVAKYYIPSGRCIQAIDYSKKDENGHGERIPDSLITAYQTKGGRTVYDGLGIEPDIKTDIEKLSALSYTLLTKYLFFDFATQFEMDNPEIDAADKFKITNEIYSDFVEYLDGKDYDYTTKCEETLEKLKKYANEEKYFEDISVEFDALAANLKKNKQDDLAKHKDEINKILRIEIISRYFYQKGKIISSLEDDIDIAKAIDIINEKDSYFAILDGSIEDEVEIED